MTTKTKCTFQSIKMSGPQLLINITILLIFIQLLQFNRKRKKVFCFFWNAECRITINYKKNMKCDRRRVRIVSRGRKLLKIIATGMFFSGMNCFFW